MSPAKNPACHAVTSRVFYCALLCAALGGCSSPNAVNNKLREENQKQEEQISGLKRDLETARASVRAMEQKAGALPTLPQDRLDKLFTVSAIKLGKLTGGDDWDPSKPNDDGIKVAVTPIDQQGDKLKAAGSFVIDAFDLAETGAPQIGHWTFDTEQSKASWYGSLMYGYVFKCPWQKRVPGHRELTVRVTFTDELTGRQFTEQVVCRVHPPPATQPTTRRAGGT